MRCRPQAAEWRRGQRMQPTACETQKVRPTVLAVQASPLPALVGGPPLAGAVIFITRLGQTPNCSSLRNISEGLAVEACARAVFCVRRVCMATRAASTDRTTQVLPLDVRA